MGASKFSQAKEHFAHHDNDSNSHRSKPPPPPPPSRSLSSVNRGRVPEPTTHDTHQAPHFPSQPPPPVRRETRPDQLSASSQPPSYHSTPSIRFPDDKIDWRNFSPQDKEVFFDWLDEFFARYLNKPLPPRAATMTRKQEVSPAPPPLLKWSRPKELPTPEILGEEFADTDFTTSYPPPTVHGSSALDMAYYFHSSTRWDSAWYKADNPNPPATAETPAAASTMAWYTRGSSKTLYGGMVFADLTFCWYKVIFSTTSDDDPNDSRVVQRFAWYTARPDAWGKDALVAAHETYGETVAGFAESYEGTGQYCGRGECWDLASEGLKYFDQFDYVPKPVPSLSRTHGHLIYEAKAKGLGQSNQIGRWRGGDDRIRRGDIAQWLSAKVGSGPNGHTVLGNPDHTAIIVSDSVPSVAVEDGMIVKPADIGYLEVVEQGVGSPPKRVKYDLSQFESGELWVYRPVSMEEYLGTMLVVEPPPSVHTTSIM
ncbi:hypothetical protein C8Q75DRAFT_718650 [Abortiporus biennis]|nr:hypothetical protein C8Q75DRAFT_718650 [Abortiporus biennis]